MTNVYRWLVQRQYFYRNCKSSVKAVKRNHPPAMLSGIVKKGFAPGGVKCKAEKSAFADCSYKQPEPVHSWTVLHGHRKASPVRNPGMLLIIGASAKTIVPVKILAGWRFPKKNTNQLNGFSEWSLDLKCGNTKGQCLCWIISWVESYCSVESKDRPERTSGIHSWGWNALLLWKRKRIRGNLRHFVRKVVLSSLP